MSRFVVATIKSWNIKNYEKLKNKYRNDEFRLINKKDDLSSEFLERYKPRYIFFPHWSWIIPKSIYENYECVVFHMTDLPFGRGGSPLQNLIVRGVYDTKISAIRASKRMDTGDVYFKEKLDISIGSADEILSWVSDIIFNRMIPRFMNEDPVPVPQEGEIVEFRRRTPDQSEIPDNLSQRQIYDYIRMLDGEGYPTAYKRYRGGRIYFKHAELEAGAVKAIATFVEEED